MRFIAKLGLCDERNAKFLIGAFFQEFNPKSSITIKGNEAAIEIFFDEPPMNIIDAVEHCKINEFIYVGSLEECENPEQAGSEEVHYEESEPETEEEDASEVIKQEISEEETSAESSKEDVESKASKTLKSVEEEIPELVEIAQKSTSYEEFVRNVGEWFEFDSRQEFFVNVVIAAGQVDKISWKSIEEILKSKNIFFNAYDKICLNKRIAAKFKENTNHITTLGLVKQVVRYQTFSFQVKTELTETPIPMSRVKMGCMPEIPEFEKVLGSVDKTQPIDVRVWNILKAMGLRKLAREKQKEILLIAKTAVRMEKEKISWEQIVFRNGINGEEATTARMTFSKFVNDFAIQYDANQKVKVLDFLIELQKIVMDESEIESSVS